MAQVITLAGERLFALKAQNNQQLDIDTFIFAYVPGQDSTAQIDRNEDLPPVNQRVHQQIVQQYGMLNDNAVVYSSVLDSLTGPFQFNWVGLYSAVNQTLVAIQHIPTVVKTVTEPGASGNILNRNFVIEYSGIAELTGITVDPTTWQYDFNARLNGMDELTRQLAADMNGKDWFIDDGFKVVPRSTLNTFKVNAGAGYVSGLRVELAADHIITLSSYPQFVYVDAWFDGTSESIWKGHVAFTVTNTEMDDYIDVNGRNHYVFKLARITAADVVDDFRGLGLDFKVDNAITEIKHVISLDINPNANNVINIVPIKNIGILQTGQSLAEGGVGFFNTPVFQPLNSNCYTLNKGPVAIGADQLGKGIKLISENVRATIGNTLSDCLVSSGIAQKSYFSGAAWGGKAYSEIRKGGSSGIYERCIEQVGFINAVDDVIYRAITLIHGEQDGINNNINYAENLAQWQSDFDADIKAITLQSEDVMLFTCQTSTAGGYGNNGGINENTFPTPLQQLTAHKVNDKICLVAPKYQYKYADNAHLTNYSQAQHGEKYGQAIAYTLSTGLKWEPVRPISFLKENNTVEITFCGSMLTKDCPLVFDTETVKDIVNKGFSYSDASGRTIVSVAITAFNKVTITLSGSIGSSPVIAYAYHNGGGQGNQSNGYGDRGNLRDSSLLKSKIDGAALQNWCVSFRESI